MKIAYFRVKTLWIGALVCAVLVLCGGSPAEARDGQMAGRFNRNIPGDTAVQALARDRATGSGETAPSGRARNTASGAASEAPAYKIGDTGPAGGIVFFDRGNSSGDWRYLEAAPAETEQKGVQWSARAFETGATETDAGTGKENTRIIMEASVQAGINVPAARLCDRLVYGGHDDWYLPGKTELGLMYTNLKAEGIGGFGNDWYWSSSAVDADRVWSQNFGSGVQSLPNPHYSNRQNGFLVRAIRQF